MKINMKELQIIPRKVTVFLKRCTETTETKKGFIIPEAVGEAQPMILGKICTMGVNDNIVFDDSFGRKLPVKNGQTVIFEKGRGTPFSIKGEEYISIDKDFIVALVNNYE